MEAARPYGFATPASIFAVSVTRFRLFFVRELMRKMSIWRLVSVDMFCPHLPLYVRRVWMLCIRLQPAPAL